jgi:glycosyltransferase involved in cell wall biosynthesis
MLLYPYVDQKFVEAEPMTFKKERIILAVGRFFSQLHSKNQDKIIDTFSKLKKENEAFKDYKLILAGGLKQEDLVYFNKLKKLAAKDRSIIFKPNITFHELYSLYEKATFYWHFTGLGINEKSHPEEVEHLGITPLEAMAMGCLVFCVNAGGPKEIISNGQTGFLFNNQAELIKKMQSVILSPTQQAKLRKSAKDFVLGNFTYTKFRQNVKKLIL